MIYRILALILKELQEQFSTARGVAVLVVPVIVQTLVFPFAATLDVTCCCVGILNEDGGNASAEIVQRVAATPYVASVKYANSPDELRELSDKREILVGLHFPPDFSRKILRGETADLQIIGDGLRSNSSQIAASYLGEILSNAAPGTSDSGLLVRHLFNPNLHYKYFLLPCLFGLLGMLTSLNISCMALAREREAGTYEQLCVTPVSPAEILLGKTIPAILIVLGQSCIILAMAVGFHGIEFHGSLAALFAVIAIYSASLTGIGFSISSLCRTQQQAFIGMFCFFVPAILLSGFLAPPENMPEAFRACTQVNPPYHIFVASRGIFLKGYGFAETFPHLVVLFLVFAGTFSLAYLTLRFSRK